MPIEPRQQLLHYRLNRKIGEGGMGEVWLARDTKLTRDVALKLLPPTFSEDLERLARFEREARTLAQLQHPNIAGVYGFEQVDDHRFLVMELAEGQDLAARLTTGPLELPDALDIARQIALGLEEAHAKGIIHRDLKPANVMIGPEGQVKILDFGLARAFDDSPVEGTLEHSPTITAAMTQAGVILGTAAYMSPEQARGRPVDPRTDIWALGAVLFEMLSGRQAYTGEVVSDVIARILEREPPWDDFPTDCHPAVRRLIQRCLAKDPKQRLHAAADARIEIESIIADPTGTADQPQPTTPVVQPAPAWRRLLPWALTALLAVAVAYSLIPTPAPQNPTVQFEILAPPDHEFGEFSVSPDGSALVFVASNRDGERLLWLRSLDSKELRPLSGTEEASFPFSSPDSRSVAFFARGKLRRLDLASGSTQTVADAPNGRGGAWSSDGTILFTPEGEDVLYRVPASGGTPVAQTSLVGDEVTHRFPHFLPGSRRFVFSAHGRDSVPTYRYFASLDSDELMRLPDGMSEAYTPPGKLLYIRERTLFAQDLDGFAGRLQGDPVPLASGINDVFPRTARSAFSVSDNGVLAYLQDVVVDTRFEWVSPDGRNGGAVAPGGEYASPCLSPDGEKVVFTRVESSALPDSIWILDLARESSSRLVKLEDVTLTISPAWSHDGTAVIYKDEVGIARQSLAGGAPEYLLRVAEAEEADVLRSLRDAQQSPDGSFIVFSAWDPVSDFDLWLLPLDGESQPRKLNRDSLTQGRSRISPDSRWIVYESHESGRAEVYVRSAEVGQTKWLISPEGGSTPWWNDDGSKLYYISSEQKMMEVPIAARGGRLEPGRPSALFDAPMAPPDSGYDFFSQPVLVGVADGRFLFQVPAERVPPRTVTVVLGWEGLMDR